jgi:hypothetical protein
VRANGAENSTPVRRHIRNWFTMKVVEIFGQSAFREDPGTENEHYHIRG